MVGRKSRGTISWADEVEREEEEAAEAKFQIQEKQEFDTLVFQERVISCINRDPILVKSRKKKPLKENVPVPTSQTFDRKPKKPHSKTSPKQKFENSEMTCYRYKGSLDTQTYGGEFVPPIRFPPKNLIPYLFPTIRTEPCNLRMGQYQSVSNADYGKRDDRSNQLRVDLGYDVKIYSKRRNISVAEDSCYNRKRK